MIVPQPRRTQALHRCAPMRRAISCFLACSLEEPRRHRSHLLQLLAKSWSASLIDRPKTSDHRRLHLLSLVMRAMQLRHMHSIQRTTWPSTCRSSMLIAIRICSHRQQTTPKASRVIRLRLRARDSRSEVALPQKLQATKLQIAKCQSIRLL